MRFANGFLYILQFLLENNATIGLSICSGNIFLLCCVMRISNFWQSCIPLCCLKINQTNPNPNPKINVSEHKKKTNLLINYQIHKLCKFQKQRQNWTKLKLSTNVTNQDITSNFNICHIISDFTWYVINFNGVVVVVVANIFGYRLNSVLILRGQ